MIINKIAQIPQYPELTRYHIKKLFIEKGFDFTNNFILGAIRYIIIDGYGIVFDQKFKYDLLSMEINKLTELYGLSEIKELIEIFRYFTLTKFTEIQKQTVKEKIISIINNHNNDLYRQNNTRQINVGKYILSLSPSKRHICSDEDYELFNYLKDLKDTAINKINIIEFEKNIEQINKNKCNPFVSCYAVFILGGKILAKLKYKNLDEDENRILGIITSYLSDSNLEEIFQSLINSDSVNARDISMLFYGLNETKFNIPNNLINELLNKQLGMIDIDSIGIGNTLYGLKESKIEIETEIIEKMLLLLVQFKDTDEWSISNALFGLKESKVDISTEVIEQIINKLIIQERLPIKGLSSAIFGLKESKVEISQDIIDNLFKKLILLSDLDAQGIGNVLFGLKESNLNISGEVCEQVILRLLSLKDVDAVSVINFLYGIKHTKIIIRSHVFKKLIKTIIELESKGSKDNMFGILFTLFLNGNLINTKELLKITRRYLGEARFEEMILFMIKRSEIISEEFLDIMEDGITKDICIAERYYKTGQYQKGLDFINSLNYRNNKLNSTELEFLRKLKKCDEVMIKYTQLKKIEPENIICVAYSLIISGDGVNANKYFRMAMKEAQNKDEYWRYTRLYTGIIFNYEDNGIIDMELLTIAINRLRQIDLSKAKSSEKKHVLNAMVIIQNSDLNI